MFIGAPSAGVIRSFVSVGRKVPIHKTGGSCCGGPTQIKLPPDAAWRSKASAARELRKIGSKIEAISFAISKPCSSGTITNTLGGTAQNTDEDQSAKATADRIALTV